MSLPKHYHMWKPFHLKIILDMFVINNSVKTEKKKSSLKKYNYNYFQIHRNNTVIYTHTHNIDF